MEEVDLQQESEISTLVKSKLEVRPPHRKDVKVFRYERPEIKSGKNRAVVRLATTDILFAIVQVFEGGGENVRHSHAAMDGFWLVLKGRARFYLDDKTVELEHFEGMCIPRGVKYWFESIGDDALEILLVDAIHPDIRNTMDIDPDHEEKQKTKVPSAIFDAQRDV